MGRGCPDDDGRLTGAATLPAQTKPINTTAVKAQNLAREKIYGITGLENGVCTCGQMFGMLSKCLPGHDFSGI
jgi:hypothetical protein